MTTYRQRKVPCPECGEVSLQLVTNEQDSAVCVKCRPFHGLDALGSIALSTIVVTDPRVPGRYGSYRSFEKAAEREGFMHLGDASVRELESEILNNKPKPKPILTVDQFKDVYERAQHGKLEVPDGRRSRRSTA